VFDFLTSAVRKSLSVLNTGVIDYKNTVLFGVFHPARTVTLWSNVLSVRPTLEKGVNLSVKDAVELG
jgi:hypothetical protein